MNYDYIIKNICISSLCPTLKTFEASLPSSHFLWVSSLLAVKLSPQVVYCRSLIGLMDTCDQPPCWRRKTVILIFSPSTWFIRHFLCFSFYSFSFFIMSFLLLVLLQHGGTSSVTVGNQPRNTPPPSAVCLHLRAADLLFDLLQHQNTTLHPSVSGRSLNQAYLMWQTLRSWTAAMMMTTRMMMGCFRVKLAPTWSHL